MKIDENTKVSIGFAVVLFGGVSWLTSLSLQTSSTAAELAEVKADVKSFSQMKTDIEVIKSDLKRILKKMGE